MASSMPVNVQKTNDSDTSCNTMHSANIYLLRTSLVENTSMEYTSAYGESQKDETDWLCDVTRQLLDASDEFVETGAKIVNRIMQSSERYTRFLATGVCQVLFNESILRPTCELLKVDDTRCTQFLDSDTVFYTFVDGNKAAARKLTSAPANGPRLNCQTSPSGSLLSVASREGRQSSRALLPESDELVTEDDKLAFQLERLYHLAVDTSFRSILTKPSGIRSTEELDFIFHELLYVPSLSKLSDTVRSELSKCLTYQTYTNKGDVVFKQGDAGISWYIIYRGSVWVHVDGKGNVCRLKEGDDFGKLALVTDGPRAASIILAEDDCHFLRVDKADFDRILRDFEANIIRLREEDSDVLILEQVNTSVFNSEDDLDERSTSSTPNGCSNYSIIAGTLEKILHHILDFRLRHLSEALVKAVETPTFTASSIQLTELDRILEVFFLTYSTYTKPDGIFALLKDYLQSSAREDHQDLSTRKTSEAVATQHCDNVVTLLCVWCNCVGLPAFASTPGMQHFTATLDSAFLGLANSSQPLRMALTGLMTECSRVWLLSSAERVVSREGNDVAKARVDVNPPGDGTQTVGQAKTSGRKFPFTGRSRMPEELTEVRSNTQDDSVTVDLRSTASLSSSPSTDVPVTRFLIQPNCLPVLSLRHQITIEVYVCRDRQPVTITVPISASVGEIKRALLEQLSIEESADHYVLVEVLSKGDHVVFNDGEYGSVLSMSPNSCLFLAMISDVASLIPLPVQLSVAMKYLDENRSTLEGNQREGLFSRGASFRKPSQLTRPLDSLSLDEVANSLTSIATNYAVCITAEELIDYTLGSSKSKQPVPHVRLLIDQFSVVHAWTITQIVTTASLTKRVQLIKKFIKLASLLISPPLCNQHTCFAIILALQSTPVARLTITWEKLPTKWQNAYSNQLLPLIDPARNHRAARRWLKSTQTPHLPFLALTLKDLRFAEDANETYYHESSPRSKLINFEKCTLIARSLFVWKKAVMGYAFLHPQNSKTYPSLNGTLTGSQMLPLMQRFTSISPSIQRQFVEQLECIDDIKVLTQLSLLQEPKK